ncbi:MAG: 3-deoxy-manno-octulosonate cytidylyltransferase synthetase [Blastocatellia bacterium]|nr:3-deoxy-manno-octulosonate cytidylyltransferase synthetase [Blastocatellia bacterium]
MRAQINNLRYSIDSVINTALTCNPVDPTGKNSKQIAVAVIPARYGSSRLPGKPLLEIAGKPLILWVIERALAAKTLSRAIVATDDARIFDTVTSAGFEAALTGADHATGTDRIAEVARNLDAEIIVNVQGDEPLIDPRTIDRAVTELLTNEQVCMATTSEPIVEVAEVLNRAVVKVVVDDDGYATSFSRNPIPWPNQAVTEHGSIEAALRDEPALLVSFRKHSGLYVYRRDFLLEFAGWPQSESERRESLEQLRALDRGVKIKVVDAASTSIGVDTLEDLERVRAVVAQTSVCGFVS